MRVLVGRVARHLGCAVDDARLRILQEGEAGRIRACGSTVEGWPVSLLPAAWRGAGWSDDVDLRLDDLVVAGLLPTAAFERARWTAAEALAWIIAGVPLEWREWAELPELGGGMEQAGKELAQAIGEDRVRAQGRLSPQGPMESLPGSDLRMPGFRWLIHPNGDLGTSPPGRLAVFQGRRWYGIEFDSATVPQAFPKPLRPERRMLADAERLHADGDASALPSREEGETAFADARASRPRRNQGIGAQTRRARAVLKRMYPAGYPTRDEVADVDLYDRFAGEYGRVEGQADPPSRLEMPSRDTVLREVGRKD
jgi:hypothetical protein